jgi:hypothetical protein
MSCSSTITSPADADAELDPGGRDGSIAIGHPPLYSTAQRTASTTLAKTRQEAIAGVLYDPALLADLSTNRRSGRTRCASFLIRPHQSRVARHIGGRDRGETAVAIRRGNQRGAPDVELLSSRECQIRRRVDLPRVLDT